MKKIYKILLFVMALCLLNIAVFATDSQIKINGLCPILNPGDTHQLTVDYKGSVEWVSEDSSIATVDQTGMVTAIAEGKTTIKAVDENDSSIFDTIKVNVNGEKSTFDLKSDYSVEYYNTIYVGKTYKIDLNDVYYGGYKYTPQSYSFWNYAKSKWQSSTDYIDHWQSGDYLYLKALKNGKTVLALQSTRGSNTLTEYYYITVGPDPDIPVKSVAIKAYINGTIKNISKKTVSVNKGSIINLYGGILPTNATNKTLTWTSFNSKVIKLESQGSYMKATAVGVGTAKITIKSNNGKTNYCYIKVSEPDIPVKSVAIKAYINGTLTNISKNYYILYLGESINLYGGILPTNATNKTLTWTSSNSKVIKLESQGSYMKATAVGVGTAKITIKSNNNKTNYCYIKVPKPPTAIAIYAYAYQDGEYGFYNISKKYVSMDAGDTWQWYCRTNPSNASGFTVKWSSNNYSCIKVTSNGLVKALKAGTAKITVKATLAGKTLSNYAYVTAYKGVDGKLKMKIVK